MKPFVVGMTGASGIPYGIKIVETLAELGHEVHVVISDSAKLVLKEEQEIALGNVTSTATLEKIFDSKYIPNIKAYAIKDFTAPIASGSFPTAGMIIAPCSMGTLGCISSGVSQNLIHRAADCHLKEGRKLVIVPRETPLNSIHLENMLKLSRMNVGIVPPNPGFYTGAKTMEDIVDFIAGKVLDQFDIVHTLYPRWTGSLKPSTSEVNTSHGK